MVQTQDVHRLDLGTGSGSGRREQVLEVFSEGSGVREWEQPRVTHFAETETEAQRDFTAHLRSHSSEAAESVFQSQRV